MELPQSLWANLFLKLLLWGIIVLLIFRLLGFGLPLIVRGKKINAIIRNSILVTELTVWIVYFSWFAFLFLEIRSLFVVIILGILAGILYLLTQFWLVDVMAGIIFKSNNRLTETDYFKYDEYEGTIKKFRKKALELENPEGKIVYIPYRKLVSGIYTKSESKLQATGYTFDIIVKNNDTYEIIKQKLKHEIISLPWSSVKKAPVIQLTDQTESHYNFKITIYAIERSHLVKIENHIKQIYVTNPDI